MSVLMNKDKTELVITCNCGCNEAAHLIIDKEDPDYYAIACFMSGNWYRDQDDTILRVIGRKLKKILAVIRNKDYYYAEIIMNKDDFKQFKDYVDSIEVEE